MFIKYLFFFLVISFIISPYVHGQSFGFGCLGLVGGFGGYSYQKYQPAGFNDYISEFNSIRSDSIRSPMSRFGAAHGFRVGLNFFRADFQGFILTTKGFYQSLSEKHYAEVQSSAGQSNYNYELRLNNWGLGLDLGTSITQSFSWKVIDAAILFNNIRLVDNKNYPGGYTEVAEYKNESTVGYTIGTGFIYSIVEGYISAEGLIGYTQIIIKTMKLDDGTELTINENSSVPMTNFIDNGGFTIVLQMNIGFPL
jgi:hypothetical protein